MKKNKGGYDYFKSEIETMYEYAKDKNMPLPGGKLVKITTTAGEYYWSNLKNESFGEFATKLAGEILQGAAMTAFFGPAGLIINEFIPISLGDELQNIYRWATGDDSTDIKNLAKKIGVKDIYITPNGFLRITMPDGTVYARPLYSEASGLITGGNRHDVLFGSSHNDTLQGNGGSDILLGGAGFDTYNVDGGDVIRDIDHKGEVYFYGKLTGGKFDKEKGYYVGNSGEKYKISGNDLIVYKRRSNNNHRKI